MSLLHRITDLERKLKKVQNMCLEITDQNEFPHKLWYNYEQHDLAEDILLILERG